MIKARASGSKVYLYFMKKGRQARHRIPRNSCVIFSSPGRSPGRAIVLPLASALASALAAALVLAKSLMLKFFM